MGLDKAMAKARVDGLTDEEVARVVQRLDQLPAGGDAFGAVIFSAVFIFLVLLVTDIMGFTDVFPFVKKTSLSVWSCRSGHGIELVGLASHPRGDYG